MDINLKIKKTVRKQRRQMNKQKYPLQPFNEFSQI